MTVPDMGESTSKYRRGFPSRSIPEICSSLRSQSLSFVLAAEYRAGLVSRVASAYGIQSAKIENDNEIEYGLIQLWQKPLEPFLLQVNIDILANAYPKIAFGYPITEMEPFIKPLDMEGT